MSTHIHPTDQGDRARINHVGAHLLAVSRVFADGLRTCAEVALDSTYLTDRPTDRPNDLEMQRESFHVLQSAIGGGAKVINFTTVGPVPAWLKS